MRNINVAVSDDANRRARIWSAKNHTFVWAFVHEILLNLPGQARESRRFAAGLPASAPAPESARKQEPTHF